MKREEFGQLVAALRKENLDVVQGKVWTQKALAARAGIAERTLGELERGSKMSMDPQMLAQLADALALTSLERQAFYAAAAAVDVDLMRATEQTPRAILDELLAATGDIRVPAYVHDSYYNLIAINTIARSLSLVPNSLLETGHDSPAGFNLMRYYFAPESPFRDLLGPGWTKFAVRGVQHFRAASLRYRHTARFAAIFEDLCRYPLFRDFWTRTKHTTEDIYHHWGGLNYHHPELGAMSYFVTEVLTLTGQEDLALVTYVPRDKRTVQRFDELAHEAGVNMIRMAAWPYEQ